MAAVKNPVALWVACPQHHARRALPVFLLCQLEEAKVAEICQTICDGDLDLSSPDYQDGDLSPVVPVHWMFPSPPPLSVILETGKETTYVFLDEQCVREGTAIVRSSVWGCDKPDVARVDLKKVNRIATAMRKTFKKLSEFVSEEAMFDVGAPPSLEEQFGVYEPVYPVPGHLPQDIRLEPATLTLFSLVHLTIEEMDSMRSSIGTTEEITSVVIHNWPDPDTPCSRAELYKMFQAIKVKTHDEVDEAYALFVDKNWEVADRNMADDKNTYHVLCARQLSPRATSYRRDHDLNHIDLFSLVDLKEAPLDFWHIIWHPFELGRKGTISNDTRINTTFDHRLRNGSFVKGNYTDAIPNPERIVIGSRGTPVFILDSSISSHEENLRAVRKCIAREDEFVMYDVSKDIETPDLRGLVAFLESSEKFLATGQEPPALIMAVDRKTLQMARLSNGDKSQENIGTDEVEGDDEALDEFEPIIIASRETLRLRFVDDEYTTYAWQDLGYGYSRVDVDCAWNTDANLSVANMYFDECVDVDGHIYWASCEPLPIDKLYRKGAYYPGQKGIQRGDDDEDEDDDP